MKKIILASASPRRRELLEKLGLDFEVVTSGFQENHSLFVSPVELVKTLALGKAESVAKKYKNGIVIGADTIVVLGNEILGKPKTLKDAERILKKLSGKNHLVFTGLAVIQQKSKKQIVDVEVSEVNFRRISEKEIKKYVVSEKPLDKAGAYALQEGAAVFISQLKGDYTNIIGLPIPKLVKILKKFGIKL